MTSDTFGPYQLHKLVGRGGMGEVHRAYDTRRERIVALKRLRPEFATDDHFLKRFLQECQRAARLTEPHVVPIHDFGEVDGRLYLDMRLVEGASLAQVLAGEEPLSPEQAVEVVAQVASALDAAHDAGLVHRDVKPSNVLLDRRGSALHSYLVDFGVAGAVGAGTSGLSFTATGGFMGTLDYLAPERLRGRPADHRVDVYSLACLLHEALTGQPPFRQPELCAMINAHLNLEPPRASELAVSAPANLDAVVARGMAKDPSERYSSAGELAAAASAALQAARVDAATTAPPGSASSDDAFVRVTAVAPAAAPVDVPVSTSVVAPEGAAAPEPTDREHLAAADGLAAGHGCDPDDEEQAPDTGAAPATAPANAPGYQEADTPGKVAALKEVAELARRSTEPIRASAETVYGGHDAALAAVVGASHTRLHTRVGRLRNGRRRVLDVGPTRVPGIGQHTRLPPAVHAAQWRSRRTSTAGPAIANLAVTGDTPGLYGGTKNNTCDASAIAAYLEKEPAKAAAWRNVLGLLPGQTESFLRSLTP